MTKPQLLHPLADAARSRRPSSIAVATAVCCALVGGFLAACSASGEDSAVPSSEAALTSADAQPESPSSAPASTPTSSAPASGAVAGEAAAASSSVEAQPAPTLYPEVPLERRRAAAASLLMPGVTSYDDALAKLRAGVGGIFITSWADPALLTQPGRDIWALRAQVGRPFDVAIDFEGGRVQRFSQVIGEFPAPQQMTAGGPVQVEEYGFQVGQRLASFGISVDFAPVLDVDGAALDVVGDRSFSRDPFVAGEAGAAFARGLQRAGIKPVFKHYPGHGRASGDTHLGAALTPPLPELFGHDLIPYEHALPMTPGVGVMVGHMVVPGLGDGVTPSSLNPHAYGLLRNIQHFDGMTYTDDLTGMRAITDFYTPDQAAVAAIAAGADQALWSTAVDVNVVIDAVDAAVADGRIHPQRFAQAVAHVDRRHGLNGPPAAE